MSSDPSKYVKKYVPFYYTGEVDLTKPTHIFPTFISHEVSRPVSKANFKKKCVTKKSMFNEKMPRIRFKSSKDISVIM
jgi:hypothetical protein